MKIQDLKIGRETTMTTVWGNHRIDLSRYEVDNETRLVNHRRTQVGPGLDYQRGIDDIGRRESDQGLFFPALPEFMGIMDADKRDRTSALRLFYCSLGETSPDPKWGRPECRCLSIQWRVRMLPEWTKTS